MISFKPIELKDIKVIKGFLKSEYSMSCEASFGTLYIWRNVYNYQYAILDDCLVIMSKDGNNPAGLRFPIGNGNKISVAHKACDYMESIGEKPQFLGVTNRIANDISEDFEIGEMSIYSDYVYETEKLISLSGKKLHSKKNHLNQFKNTYNYQYCPITPNDKDEILKAYEGWGKVTDKYLEAERDSISDVLTNMYALDISGAMLKVDGNIVAFTLGEELNKDTAVIHIEKADPNIKGAYTAINQMFAENRWKDYKYINREDDCGIEGLKKAKQSYQPIFMVEKYRAVRR